MFLETYIMDENIIDQNIIFNNCNTGTDSENKTPDFLGLAGFNAKKIGGANDGGIDIGKCEYSRG